LIERKFYGKKIKTETTKISSRQKSGAARQKEKLIQTGKTGADDFQEQIQDALQIREETLAQEEARKWASLQPTAAAAFNFWNDFLALRMGATNTQTLDAASKNKIYENYSHRFLGRIKTRHG